LVLMQSEPGVLPSRPRGAEDQVEDDEQSAQVKLALGTLSSRDQEVLLLWDAGLSYPEIAEQSGLAVGAIGTTLARARRRLVEAHERQNYHEADVAHS